MYRLGLRRRLSWRGRVITMRLSSCDARGVPRGFGRGVVRPIRDRGRHRDLCNRVGAVQTTERYTAGANDGTFCGRTCTCARQLVCQRPLQQSPRQVQPLVQRRIPPLRMISGSWPCWPGTASPLPPDTESHAIAAAADVCRMISRGDDFEYVESFMVPPQGPFAQDQAEKFTADAISAYCPHAAFLASRRYRGEAHPLLPRMASGDSRTHYGSCTTSRCERRRPKGS